MKIHLLVKSPLLNKTLESYLDSYIVSFDECDFIIADEIDESVSKPICLIDFSEDADILRPVYKESLMRDLGIFYAKLQEIQRVDVSKFESVLDLGELSRLRESLDSINGVSEVKQDSKKKDIKSEIERIVQDFTERLYEVLKDSKQ